MDLIEVQLYSRGGLEKLLQSTGRRIKAHNSSNKAPEMPTAVLGPGVWSVLLELSTAPSPELSGLTWSGPGFHDDMPGL